MDEDLKRKAQVSIIAFGIVVMIYQFFWNWGSDFDVFGLLFKAVPLALVVAAISFGVMTVLDKK
jgi:hypothetical protein